MSIPIIGTIIDKVIGKGADLISEVITDKDQAARLRHELELAVLADGQTARELEAELFKAQQETIQAELHQSDLYTKRTRPKIARLSFYGGILYALLTALPAAGVALPFGIVIMPWTFEWSVLMLLYSPALTYMGVRGFEKWRAGGA